jgi:hypothetical protein
MPNPAQLHPDSAPADAAPQVAAGGQFVRLPNALVGRIINGKRSGAHALHLLAIKIAERDRRRWAASDPQADFVLNEKHTHKEHGVGRRVFRSGITRLAKSGALTRQHHGRAFATEQLKKPRDAGFVPLPLRLLDCPLPAGSDRSALIAFVIAVNLDPAPQRPETVARKFGIRSRVTVRSLVQAARSMGVIAHATSTRKAVLVARAGHNFDQVKNVLVKNVPDKNVPDKNVPTQSQMKNSNLDERDHHRSQEKSRSADASRAQGRAGRSAHEGDDDDLKRDRPEGEQRCEPRYLRDWELSLGDLAPPDRDVPVDCLADLEHWRWLLDRYGGAPEHLQTLTAHRHACEMAHWLAQPGHLDASHALYGIAFAVCEAHQNGKQIRSLGFIAKALMRRTAAGDLSWYLNLPPPEDDEDYTAAETFARKAVQLLSKSGFPFELDHLLASPEIEMLGDALGQYGQDRFLAAIKWAIANKQKWPQNGRAWRWTWFAECVAEMASAAEREAIETNRTMRGHLNAIVAADRARKLNDKLRGDLRGLHRFLNEQSRAHSGKSYAAIVGVMIGVLEELGREGGGTCYTYRSWKTFARSIAEAFSQRSPAAPPGTEPTAAPAATPATKPRRSAADALRLLIDADPKGLLAEPLRADVAGLERFLAVGDVEAVLEAMLEYVKHGTVIGRAGAAIKTWEEFRPSVTDWLAYRAKEATTKRGA